MFLRSLFVAAAALMLSGCTGWWSETRLIPVSARDQAGLAGTYYKDDESVSFAPAAQGLVRGISSDGEVAASEAAFALLREEAPRPSSFPEEAMPVDGGQPSAVLPDRSYLMEIPFSSSDGKTAYFYAIARIAFAADGSAETIGVFTPLCAKATEAFAARKEDQACIFDDYAKLRAAAFDALAWYDDARMVIDETVWQRVDLGSADAAAPAGP